MTRRGPSGGVAEGARDRRPGVGSGAPAIGGRGDRPSSGPRASITGGGRDRGPSAVGGDGPRRGPGSGIAEGGRDRGPGAGGGDGSRRGPGNSITGGGRDRGPGAGDRDGPRRQPGGTVADGRGPGAGPGRTDDRRDGPYGDRHKDGHGNGRYAKGNHKDHPHKGHHDKHYAHKGHGHKGRYYGKDYYYKDRHHHHYYDRYRYRPNWWVGLLGYGIGYLHGGYYGGYYYSDPYYYGSTVYTQPYAVYDVPVDDGVVVPESAPEAAADPDDGDLSERYLIAAEDAFRAGEYEKALRDIQHALLELPGDGRAILFLSQALLATGRYQAATSAAYQGMSLLDEKDWGFVAENYDKYYGNDDYVAQMKKLGAYIKANPKSAYAYALRGYHWGFLDYPEAARKDLAKAVELEPRDEMAARLLKKFGGKIPAAKPDLDADEGPALPPPPEGEPPLKLKGDTE